MILSTLLTASFIALSSMDATPSSARAAFIAEAALLPAALWSLSGPQSWLRHGGASSFAAGYTDNLAEQLVIRVADTRLDQRDAI
jgi:hypothetical protein